MAQHRRSSENIPRPGGLGTGPILGKVVSHLDPTYMGGLQVTLLKYQSNVIGDDTQSYIVRAAPPFFGATNYSFMGYNPSDFNDTQKSYGMWMVPPDVGVTVICIFIDGDPSQGYWIGCVPSRFTNNMVPGIAATTSVEWDQLKKQAYNTKNPVPVGEVNRRLNAADLNTNFDKIKKPLHPIAGHFLAQGVIEDTVRGTTSSSARREVPSAVFGISTPGPLDRSPGSKREKIGTIQSPTETGVPVSRLGGTQFVMDDGDSRYFRKAPSTVLGFEGAYVDVTQPNTKVPSNIPKDEHFRIRTRTGHQILMHNAEDLIYIGNSRGTVWIELTANGKIDIFAEDSISIHTKNDMNFRADRDMNFEAGRNINIKTTGEFQATDNDFIYNNDLKVVDYNNLENGRIQIESAQNFNLLIGRDGKIQCRNSIEDVDENGNPLYGNLEIKVRADMKIAVRDPDAVDGMAPEEVGKTESELAAEKEAADEELAKYREERAKQLEEEKKAFEEEEAIKAEEDEEYVPKKWVEPEDPTVPVPGLHIYSYENIRIKTEKDVEINTTLNNRLTAGEMTEILSVGNHVETAAEIHMNGPAATEALIARIAAAVKVLPTFENEVINDKLTWSESKFLSDETVSSIMKRIPMHEPWSKHENLSPLTVNKASTDREKDKES